jgi:glycosyltransferase involved in cell wall biosynthesis
MGGGDSNRRAAPDVARLVFWETCLSPHRSSYMRELATRPGLEVTVVVDEEIPEWRRRMGWTSPDYGACRVEVSPTRARLISLAEDAAVDCIHLYTPARAFPTAWNGFRRSAAAGARIAIISEPYDWRGWRGMLRLARGRADAIRYRWRTERVLAIGHLAKRWFERTGFPRDRIVPWGYFTERPADVANVSQIARIDDTVHIAFIGQCIRRKGIDVLLRALASLRGQAWTLHIVGDGSARAGLEALARRLNIAKQVRFHGNQPHDAATRFVNGADMLVLPSRWDGWGAVVNEALMRGVPVICSDRCGAADLLVHPSRGEVVRAASVESLQAALARRISLGPLDEAIRAGIREWAARIQGPAAAHYLLRAIAHDGVPGAPPWLEV